MNIEVHASITNYMFECCQCFGTFIGTPYMPPEDLKHEKNMRGTVCNKCGERIEARLRKTSEK